MEDLFKLRIFKLHFNLQHNLPTVLTLTRDNTTMVLRFKYFYYFLKVTLSTETSWTSHTLHQEKEIQRDGKSNTTIWEAEIYSLQSP